MDQVAEFEINVENDLKPIIKTSYILEEINNKLFEELYVPTNTMIDSPPSKSYIPINIVNRYSDIFINNNYLSTSTITPSTITPTNTTESLTESLTDSSDSSDDSISYCTYKNKYNSNNIFLKKQDNIQNIIRETAENIMRDIIQDIVDTSLDDIIQDIISDSLETDNLIDSTINKKIQVFNNDSTSSQITSTDEILFNKNKKQNDKKIEGCFKQLCRFLCNKIKK